MWTVQDRSRWIVLAALRALIDQRMTAYRRRPIFARTGIRSQTAALWQSKGDSCESV